MPKGLEPRHYLEPDLLRRELTGLFERTWQYAGHVCDLAEPGSYVTATAGDQPVLVIRHESGGLRAFRNVCRHRGSKLLSGNGRCKRAIRCRYHGWTYDAGDGRLLGVPEHRAFAGLEKAELGLHPARVEALGGLVFVNLDLEARPIAEETGDLGPRLERHGVPSLMRFGPTDGGTQPANWKIVVENYLEGYHVPIAHPGLMRLLDYRGYAVEVHDSWVWFEAPMRDTPSGNRLERLYQRLARPMPELGGGDRRVWRYAFVYPNTTIDLYPDQVTTWQIVPEGVSAARDVWGCFRPAGCGPLTRVTQRVNHVVNTTVLNEDIDLVGGVQAGVRTRGWSPGPLAAREAAVGWFAERIRADLARDPE